MWQEKILIISLNSAYRHTGKEEQTVWSLHWKDGNQLTGSKTYNMLHPQRDSLWWGRVKQLYWKCSICSCQPDIRHCDVYTTAKLCCFLWLWNSLCSILYYSSLTLRILGSLISNDGVSMMALLALCSYFWHSARTFGTPSPHIRNEPISLDPRTSD